MTAKSGLVEQKRRERLATWLDEEVEKILAEKKGGSQENRLAKFKEWVEEMEARHGKGKGRSNFDVPELWRSWYYLRQGYHLGKPRRASHRHWQGGEMQHRGAKCYVCRRPLALLWDIDCTDPRFRRESPDLFKGLERLPLYYCCRCPSPTIYRCTAPGRITVLPVERRTSEESPFEDVPEFFPRHPLVLDPIPSDIENLIQLTEWLGFDWLHQSDRRALAKYFGESSTWVEVRRSQFGGIPALEQGHSEIPCPNLRCPTHSWGDPFGRHDEYFQMKELAVIEDDANFEMETSCAQIIFHICWACQTIHAEYGID